MSERVTAPKLHWALDRIKREPFFQHNFQVYILPSRLPRPLPPAAIGVGVL
jgi:hypothetical protein